MSEVLIESEKKVDKALVRQIEKRKGWCLKLLATHITGLPDRMCLLPGKVIFFVEVKTTGEEARPIQKVVHKRLKKLGFNTYILDRTKDIETIITKETC